MRKIISPLRRDINWSTFYSTFDIGRFFLRSSIELVFIYRCGSKFLSINFQWPMYVYSIFLRCGTLFPWLNTLKTEAKMFLCESIGDQMKSFEMTVLILERNRKNSQTYWFLLRIYRPIFVVKTTWISRFGWDRMKVDKKTNLLTSFSKNS